MSRVVKIQLQDTIKHEIDQSLLGNQWYDLPFLYWWSSSYVGGCSMEKVFLQHALKPLNTVRDSTVCPAEGVEIFVDTLRSLFSHHPKPNVPLLQPGDNMLLQHVHLWKHCRLWEVGTVIGHELFDIALWKTIKVRL